ncbi:MAG: class I SAM-dependent methyltransferase [Armatimonadota bacterium]
MEWYKDLFAKEDPFRAERYSESESSRREVDFVIEALELNTGDRILDLCCGQGRHLIDLMRRRYDVVGVDLSEYMLDKCREAASKEGLEPRLIQADMRELPFNSEFDAIIIMWNSFGYLESDVENQKAIDRISQALKPCGRLLLDHLINRDSFQKRFGWSKSWYENEAGDIFLSEPTFDSITGRMHEREICIRANGERSESNFDLRIYTYGELEKMLDASSMVIKSVWGDRSFSEFTSESKAMEIVAVKC